MSTSVKVLEIKIKQEKNNQQRNRHDDFKSFTRFLHIFILAAPVKTVSDRQFYLFSNRLLGAFHVAADVLFRCYIHIDPGLRPGAFGLDGRRPSAREYVRHLLQRDTRSGRRGDQHAPKIFRALPQFPGVAHVDGITLQAFDGGCNVHAADSRLNYVVYVINGKPVSGRFLSLDYKIGVKAAGHPLGINAAGAGKAAESPVRAAPRAFAGR